MITGARETHHTCPELIQVGMVAERTHNRPRNPHLQTMKTFSGRRPGTSKVTFSAISAMVAGTCRTLLKGPTSFLPIALMVSLPTRPTALLPLESCRTSIIPTQTPNSSGMSGLSTRPWLAGSRTSLLRGLLRRPSGHLPGILSGRVLRLFSSITS